MAASIALVGLALMDAFIKWVALHALPHEHFHDTPCQITYAEYDGVVVWDYEQHKAKREGKSEVPSKVLVRHSTKPKHHNRQR